jgi:hypothetical protein
MNDIQQKEQELIQEYISKGYDYKKARHYAHQRALRLVVSELKTKDPAAYARLQLKVYELQQAKEREEQERTEAERLAAERERLVRRAQSRCKQALTCVGLPLPSLKDVYLPSFRTWNVVNGWLMSVAQTGHCWREVNVADRLPDERNTSGLYSIRPDPVGLITSINSYLGTATCCGLVSLGGRVIEHTDGWMRAEYAKILCIWYLNNQPDAYVDVPLLMKHYPTTPVFVCSQRQVCEALCAVMVLGVRA